MRKRERGTALIEMTLMMPWLAFLFVGILDFGVYAYSAIGIQSAARATAINVASQSGDTTNACSAALGEMSQLLNVDTNTMCVALGSVSNSTPVGQCVAILTDTASSPCGLTNVKCADCSLIPYTGATSVVAVITYRGVQMIPIPGILTDRLQMTRVAEARLIP